MTTVIFNEGDESPNIRYTDNGDGSYTPQTELAIGTYLGQQMISGNGANQNATVPIGTKAFYIMSETGAVYAAINAVAATTAGIYIPQDNIRYLGPYSNITSLGIFAASGVKAHIIYES